MQRAAAVATDLPAKSVALAPSSEPELTTVETRMTFPAPPERAWKTLMFYEQVERRPPLLLRVLLPVPLGTTGSKGTVGDEARCLYQSGHLIKRVTRIEPGSHYGFAVIEQALPVGRGVRLCGGSYTLRAISGGRTEIVASTRYSSERRPRWLWAPIESAVCHLFHRFILGEMRRALAP